MANLAMKLETDQVKHKTTPHLVVNRATLIALGYPEELLDDYGIRSIKLCKKFGVVPTDKTIETFELNVEGPVKLLVVATLEDNLTISAFICHQSISYLINKGGNVFTFNSYNPNLPKILEGGNFDPLSLIGTDLLHSNIQRGRAVHDETSRLSKTLWASLIWGGNIKDLLKTNFLLKRGKSVIKCKLYLNKNNPEEDVISFNGYCHKYVLGEYPGLTLAKANHKIAKNRVQRRKNKMKSV